MCISLTPPTTRAPLAVLKMLLTGTSVITNSSQKDQCFWHGHNLAQLTTVLSNFVLWYSICDTITKECLKKVLSKSVQKMSQKSVPKMSPKKCPKNIYVDERSGWKKCPRKNVPKEVESGWKYPRCYMHLWTFWERKSEIKCFYLVR